MKKNRELKTEAKAMLKGNWMDAVLLNLVPTLLLLAVFYLILLPSFMLIYHFTGDGASITAQSNSGTSSGGQFISGLIGTFFSLAVTWTLLDMLRHKREKIVPFKDAFRTFTSPYALVIFVVYLLQTIFIALWSLLLIIPGIIKRYSYYQAYNIFYDTYEHTGERLGFLDCITASRKLMNGHKGQLFILEVSFIGWHILAIMTLGIGYLWLNPYIAATKAAFYDALPKELA